MVDGGTGIGSFSVRFEEHVNDDLAVLIPPKPAKSGHGQESLCDYPRPPRLEPFTDSITVKLDGRTARRQAPAQSDSAGLGIG